VVAGAVGLALLIERPTLIPARSKFKSFSSRTLLESPAGK
jgi:hypothetical protein